jgi:DNA-binding LacI/PurR family transcriptional regulator
VTKHISDWAKETGIKRSTISARLLSYGWSVERALTERVVR